MKVVNAYTISPDDIEVGDVMVFTVKAMVTSPGYYRLYRCPYTGEVPQGSRIVNEEAVCEALFPSLAMVALADPS